MMEHSGLKRLLGRTTSAHPIQVRWMLRSDLPDVVAIDAAAPEPLGESGLRRALAQSHCIGMVVTCGTDVGGFMVYELLDRSVHVIRMVVSPAWRRRGAGRALITRLFDKLSHLRRPAATFLVSEQSTDMHLFLRSVGFRATRILRGHLCAGRADAYWFAYHLENADGS